MRMDPSCATGPRVHPPSCLVHNSNSDLTYTEYRLTVCVYIYIYREREILGSQIMDAAQSPRSDRVVHGASADRITSPRTGQHAHTKVHNRQMLSDWTGTGPRSHTPVCKRHMRYHTTSPRGPVTLGPNGGII
jgi:hypothetical protein